MSSTKVCPVAKRTSKVKFRDPDYVSGHCLVSVAADDTGPKGFKKAVDI